MKYKKKHRQKYTVHLFILHTVHPISCCPHSDQTLLMLPTPHIRRAGLLQRMRTTMKKNLGQKNWFQDLGPPEYDTGVQTIIPKHQAYSTCNLIFWTWDRFPEARYRPSVFIFSSLRSMVAIQCWTNAGTLGDSPLHTSARWQPKTGSSEKIKNRNIYNSYKIITFPLVFSEPFHPSVIVLSVSSFIFNNVS